MSRARRNFAAAVGFIALIGWLGTGASAGTSEGHYAASLVDRARYEHVHGDLLFTHDGDDRGWGPQHDLARDNIRALFNSYGLATTLHPFSYDTTYYNVVAEQPGTTRPNDIYIIGAHFDSMTLEWIGNPGADDNATGVAAVLEIARIVSQWPSAATIRFIAFDREEEWMIGSYAYATDHASDHIVGMVALDMLAYRKSSHNAAEIYGQATSGDVKRGLISALRDYGGLSPTDQGPTDDDHIPFEELGFQAAMVIEPDPFGNPNIHTQRDSLDTPGYIDYEYAAAFTRGVVGWLVDQAGVTPTHPLGDLNCDYGVDEGDIDAFILALSGQAAYEAQYPSGRWLNADCNGDGVVSYADINPFLALVKHDCSAPQVVAKLLAADGTPSEYFGVAAAVSGNTAVIGASGAGAGAGAAYIYERTGGVWTQTATLVAADAADGARFGSAVAIDGNTVVIGARFASDFGGASGSAYVFERTGGVWTQTAKLLAADGAGGDRFGSTVAVSGETIVVGAPFDDDHANNSGSAYVFAHWAGEWTQTDKLTAADAAANANFGFSVAVSEYTAVIGTYMDDAPQADCGSVYVFMVTPGGWVQAAKLTAADGRAGDRFGYAVALSGNRAVIGSYRYALGGGAAAAYVFERLGSVWNQTAKLASWAHTGGLAVALDGTTAVVGRSGGDLTPDSTVYDAGEVYVFTQQRGIWRQAAELHAWDAAPTDYFGCSVGVSGGTAVVGALQDDDLGTDSGSTYVLDLRARGMPWLALQPADQTVAVSTGAIFTALATGPRTLHYQWYKDGELLVDGGMLSGATTATLTIEHVAESDAGSYAVVVSSPCGTTTSAAATLTVVPLPYR